MYALGSRTGLGGRGFDSHCGPTPTSNNATALNLNHALCSIPPIYLVCAQPSERAPYSIGDGEVEDREDGNLLYVYVMEWNSWSCPFAASQACS